MAAGNKTRAEKTRTFRAFLVELAVYAALVTAYFFLVLHFLGDWLNELEKAHAKTYAGVALLLILGQAVALEGVTTFLLRLIRGRSE